MDIGSGEQYRKEKFIVENKESLSPIQRITVTEKYRPYYEKKAKEKMLSTQNNKTGAALPKSDKLKTPIHTTDELAKLANVGHTAYLIRGTKFRSPYI